VDTFLVQLLVLLGVYEALALLVIGRLWARRRHKRLLVRVLWSVVLLAPIFGILAYVFLMENPEEHPYYTADHSASDAETFHSER
jgi:hypothetical protein